MILRRIGEGLRKQDWFTVVVEIFIVVIGIYIGLQVDDWQKERTERVREQFVLAQLQEDFEESKESLAGWINFYEGLVEDLRFVVETMESGKLAAQDTKRFNQAYYYNNVLISPEVVMGTYHSLVAAGEFDLIQDKILRKQLLSLDTELVKRASMLNYFRDYFMSTSEELDNLLFFRIDKKDGSKIIEVDFEDLLKNKMAQAFITERYFDHARNTEGRKELLVIIENILTRMKELGVGQ